MAKEEKKRSMRAMIYSQEMLAIIRDCRDYGVSGEPLSFGLTDRLQEIIAKIEGENCNNS